MLTTLDRLEQLEAQAQAETPTSTFAPNYGEMLISCIIDHPQFAPIQYLKPEYFRATEQQYVVAAIIDYHKRHDQVPTRIALEDYIVRHLQITVDDPYEQILALVHRATNAREIPHVKQHYLAWVREQAYGRIYSPDAMEAFQRGDYSALTALVAEANAVAAGTEPGEPFGFVDAAEFLQEEIQIEWLIDGLLVKDQPCIVGGKDKCLKTGMTCDLAISLATGTRFLGHFEVPQPRRVIFFSAESGKMDIKRRFAAVLKGKGLETLPTDMLKISFERPQLSNIDDLAKLGTTIAKYGAEVVIVDPLYLTLLAGDDSGTSAADLYGMGAKFGALSDVIAKAGATAVLVHHYKKTTEEGVLGLNEFTFTGASAFARQSLHIGRRRPYSGPTTNEMRFQNHGFANGTTYALDINEDTWECRIEPETEATVRSAVNRGNADAADLLAHLQQAGQPLSKNRIREDLAWNEQRFARALAASVGQVAAVLVKGQRRFQAV